MESHGDDERGSRIEIDVCDEISPENFAPVAIQINKSRRRISVREDADAVARLFRSMVCSPRIVLCGILMERLGVCN
jgi:hypothetical protein